MYYEINVSLNGRHLFATASRSITSEEKAHEMFELFRVKFPCEDGYLITVAQYENVGFILEW